MAWQLQPASLLPSPTPPLPPPPFSSQLEELRRREASDEQAMYSIARENKRMSDPMRRVLDEARRGGGGVGW